MKLYRLVWVIVLLLVWPVYGLLLTPFYLVPAHTAWWYASRAGMLGVAVVFGFLSAWLLNRVFSD